MPDEPQPKYVAHPARAAAPGRIAPSRRSLVGEDDFAVPFVISGLKAALQPVCEIEVTSNFSFLSGASLPEELVREAARLGHAGIAITDAETLGGAVRAHVAAKETRLPLAHGVRVRLELGPCDGPHVAPHPASSAGQRRALEVLLYATDRDSWGALSSLLTRGKRGSAAPASDESPGGIADAAVSLRWSKSVCVLRFHDLVETLLATRGGATLLAVVVPPWLPDQSFLEAVQGLARLMPDRIAIAVRRLDDAGSVAESGRALILARHLGVPPVAAGDVRMHDADRRPLLDVLACIGARTTLACAGTLVAANAERRLRDPEVLRRRYLDLPEALATAWRFTERASAFSLDALRYEYPSEVVPAGTTAMEHLRALTLRGAAERYPRGIPEKVRGQLEHEFAIIGDLRYEHYFLTVHEIVAFARGRGILCQGRGAAANSAVCFALGVTAVDPDRVDVLFERFVSRERNEPPDIDIDFEHERREEVIQHIYAKYGRDRAALVAEIVSYRGRSAVRDVAKVLGFSKDTIDRLASEVDRWSGGGLGTRDDAADLADLADRTVAAVGGEGESRRDDAPSWPPPVSAAAAERLRAAGLDPCAPRVRHLANLVGQILGFPRHRSQHVGGFVITNGPLAACVPIENAAMPDRTVIEWDKDDIDALGMLKIDILSLGMLTAVRKAIDLVNGDRTALALGAAAAPVPDAPPPRADRAPASASALAGGQEPLGPRLPLEPPELLEFHAIPAEDPSTYDMISRADTVGVFQIESRAQMSMLPRLRPRCFYDLVVEVAIVRPGPIQGDMVHPYLRRRNGEEAVDYPDEAIRRVLGKTLGVPLFQEQAMALAVVAAGFTPGQADELRRAIAAWKRHGNQIARFGEQLEGGMLARGYSRRFATQVFEQIKGFSGYGFPESHAASFALLVYASAWLKRHHPAAFTTALLNSQPMGFYAPSQLVRDAVEHGVAVRAIDVHCSRWDSTLERGPDPAAWISDARISGESACSGDAFDGGIGIVPACTGDPAASKFARRGGPRTGAATGWGGPGVYRLRVAAAPAAPPHPRVRIDGVRIESLGEVPALDQATPANGSGLEADAGGDVGTRRWRFLTDVFGTREPTPTSTGDGSSEHAATRRLHGRGRSVATAADAVIDRIRRPSQDGRTAAVESASDASLYFVRAQPAIRLGLRLVRGLDAEEGHRIVEAIVRHGPFSRLSDLQEASGVRVAALRRLAAADAFRSMGLDRQQAAWQILALRDRGRALWSFGSASEQATDASDAVGPPCGASVAAADPPEPSLPPIQELSGIARDLESAGVSLRGHPIACLRPKLQRIRVIPCGFLRDERRTPAGRIVSVAGMVLIRQRPSTAKGILFITIEDETGTANLIVRPKTYARLRPALRGSVVLRVRGKVERRDGVTHVIVAEAEDMTGVVES